jgi:hypothetical protein
MRATLVETVQKVNSPTRRIGLGADFRGGQTSQDNNARFVGAIGDAIRAPNWTVPVIEQVRIHYDGPLTDQQIATTFGSTIDPLGSNRNSPPPGAVAVETTMAEPGKFQNNVLVLGVGWRFLPEPLIFTAKGNAWTIPTTGTAAPVSPDDFVNQDFITNGPLFNGAALSNTTFVQSWLDWGGWQELAAFHMAHAYNLVWQMGNRTYLLNDSLKNTMYVPSAAQNGSASSSEQDVAWYTRLVNNYYRNTLQAGFIFLPVERTRIGSFTMTPTGSTSTAGLSVFRPTRAYETVGATYGGMGLRGMLHGNRPTRRLTSPFLMKPGVPIGLRADVALNSSNDQAEMQAWLSGTFGPTLGGALGGNAGPPPFQADINVNVTGTAAGGATGMEPSLDSTVAAQPMTTLQSRMPFKGGSWKIEAVVEGFELTDAQADYLKDPTVQATLQSMGCCGSALPNA